MSYDTCRITIEQMENGWKVTLPDRGAMKKADAKKKSSDAPTYMGEMTKDYIAKNVKDVLKMVEASLKSMPESEYDKAWEEA